MRIDRRAQTLGLVTRARTPTLPVSDKETLLRSKSFDRLQRLAFGVVLPRHVRKNQSAEIGHVFAQGQLPVDLDIVKNYVLRILIRDATGSLLKCFGVFGSPPVPQIAVRVELAPFIVEAMRKLMSDGSAGIAEVGSRVGIRIEQWRLQNPGGEIYIVHLRIVVRIYRGRSHEPFAEIHGLANLRQLTLKFEFAGVKHVAHFVVADD